MNKQSIYPAVYFLIRVCLGLLILCCTAACGVDMSKKARQCAELFPCQEKPAIVRERKDTLEITIPGEVIRDTVEAECPPGDAPKVIKVPVEVKVPIRHLQVQYVCTDSVIYREDLARLFLAEEARDKSQKQVVALEKKVGNLKTVSWVLAVIGVLLLALVLVLIGFKKRFEILRNNE